MQTTEFSARTWRGTATCLVLVFWFGFRSGGVPAGNLAQSTAASRLVPDGTRLADAPELANRLARSPMALFRFVNETWTQEACAALAGELPLLPVARLHGDAHIEQYAITADTRGMDDFDDSARGPAAIDMVRFLGSLELASNARGWTDELAQVIDTFFLGYRRGLGDPRYLPPDPAVVTRLRGRTARTPVGFAAWAESLMQPMTSDELARIDWPRFQSLAARVNPKFTPAFMRPKKLGWVRIGIGSALNRKILALVEGPSTAVDDDMVIEAKEVRAHRSDACAKVKTVEPQRVVKGVQQLGRVRQGLLLALPSRDDRPDGRGWSVRTWEPSFREMSIEDLDSPGELREVAFDVGVQLGSNNFYDLDASVAERARKLEHEGLARLESRIREVAHELTLALLEAWERYRTQRAAG